MDRNFTLNIYGFFKKATLIMALAIAVFAIQSFTLNDSFDSNIVQPKTIKCYPNPAISFVNFEFGNDALTKNYSLQVFSFTGKKMYETSVNNQKITLTLTNDFYRGIYVYQLIDKSGRILETGKFQVAK